jgi:transcriptional regulator with XRE-family HTH domain
MEGTHKYIASKTGVSACTVSRIRAGKDIVSHSPSFKLSKRLDSLWKITKSVDDE